MLRRTKAVHTVERKMPVSEKLMFTVLGLLVLVNILDVTRMCWLLGRFL